MLKLLLMMLTVILIGCNQLALLVNSLTGDRSEAAPDFTLDTFNGATIRLSDFRGKVVVINFWASWCSPCALEAPELQALWEHYQSRDDVVFVGVAYADYEPYSLEYLKDYGITYFMGRDVDNSIIDDFGVAGVPETFILDQNGTIVSRIFGMVTAPHLQTIIDNLLAEGSDL